MFHQEMRYGGSPLAGSSQMKVVSRLASQALALSLMLSLTPAFADEPAPDADRDHRHRHSEIWLAPQSLPLPPLSRDEDFMQLFTPDAPWHFAVGRRNRCDRKRFDLPIPHQRKLYRPATGSHYSLLNRCRRCDRLVINPE